MYLICAKPIDVEYKIDFGAGEYIIPDAVFKLQNADRERLFLFEMHNWSDTMRLLKHSAIHRQRKSSRAGTRRHNKVHRRQDEAESEPGKERHQTLPRGELSGTQPATGRKTETQPEERTTAKGEVQTDNPTKPGRQPQANPERVDKHTSGLAELLPVRSNEAEAKDHRGMAAQAAQMFQAETMQTSHRHSPVPEGIRGGKDPELAVGFERQGLVAFVQQSRPGHRQEQSMVQRTRLFQPIGELPKTSS